MTKHNFHNKIGSIQDRIKKYGHSALTNAEFAQYWQPFRNACKDLDIIPTARQAAKYRQKKGLVYNA